MSFAAFLLLTLLPQGAPVPAGQVALARQAVAEDDAAARAAVQALRAMGPRGLDALLALRGSGPRWEAAVDAVAAQRDASASGLYWYTDLEAAVAAARLAGRPILSLRLLGRLDEELSCANSRFFRTVLYPDAAVSRALRERFVLHWQSERPVPRVSIDMGDGRRLEGTITGNSIHYVLDARGRVVDALPGLYGPRAFLRALAAAEEIARGAAGLEGNEWRAFVSQAHRRVLETTGAPMLAAQPVRLAPTAADASRRAASKALVETPLLRALARDGQPAAADAALSGREVAVAEDGRLGAASRALLWKKHEARARAAGVAPGRREDVIARFERVLAEDTARNEGVLHPLLHAWFADGAAGPDLAALNVRVYAELFLTPASDPWLGLLPGGVYAALDPAR
jgi:hypothetical protein